MLFKNTNLKDFRLLIMELAKNGLGSKLLKRKLIEHNKMNPNLKGSQIQIRAGDQ